MRPAPLNSKSTFHRDFLASIVVFLVALPLCMGIAIASDVPPALGIITGIVGGIIVGVISGAPLQVSGPAAGLTVLVFEIIRTHGIGLLGPIVLAAGLIQLLAGFFRLGQWFRAVNPSVIHGMLGGIGVLILLSQFHVMLDTSPKGSGLANLLAIPEAIYSVVAGKGSAAHWQAGLIGLLTISVMKLWDFTKHTSLKVIPAPLAAIVVSTVFVFVSDLGIQKVDIPGTLWQAVSLPNLSSLSSLLNLSVIGSVLSLAIIASAETLLCASALTKLKVDAKSDYDKELIAQGVGNSLCGLLGALPMTGVIVRSTANIQAGAETRLSAIFHGFWLLALVMLAPGLLRLIPMASLAAVLVFTGYKLFNPAGIKQLARYGTSAVVIYLVTIIGVVGIDLLTGVLLGVAASLLRLVQTLSGLHVSTEETPSEINIHLRGSATVLSLPKLARVLENLPMDKSVTLNLEQLSYLDHACMDLIETVRAQRKQTGAELRVDSGQMKLKYLRSQTGRVKAWRRPKPALSKVMIRAKHEPLSRYETRH